MLFGEIVEPSTRALIEEDLDEYPTVTQSEPVWDLNLATPAEIDVLIFIETEKVRKLFHNCVLNKQTAVARIKNGGIEVFDLGNKEYIIAFSEKKELTCGEITELFDKWITRTKNLYMITSESLSSYQNINLSEKPVSLIRVLSNDPSKSFGYDRLESPNLVSGLGASVLSYCIHVGIKCTLFIAYIDTSPLDSVNMGPLLGLLRKINVPVSQTEVKIAMSSSNLYT